MLLFIQGIDKVCCATVFAVENTLQGQLIWSSLRIQVGKQMWRTSGAVMELRQWKNIKRRAVVSAL